MIETLNKTYDLFPKQEGETERLISVAQIFDGTVIRMTIHINGIRHSYSQQISHFEILSHTGDKKELDDVLLRRICREFHDQFDK